MKISFDNIRHFLLLRLTVSHTLSSPADRNQPGLFSYRLPLSVYKGSFYVTFKFSVQHVKKKTPRSAYSKLMRGVNHAICLKVSLILTEVVAV
jgi:hypothetical protein